jgi:hypothetical protein
MIMVGEGVASPAATSEPDMRLSPHPAPLSRSPLFGHHRDYSLWLRAFRFAAIARTTPCSQEVSPFPLMSTAQPVTQEPPLCRRTRTCYSRRFPILASYYVSSIFLTVSTSAYPGRYPRPLLFGQSSPWLHWLEPTGILGVSSSYYTRANQGFPRSESSFVAALGLHSTPGYFLCENETTIKRPAF